MIYLKHPKFKETLEFFLTEKIPEHIFKLRLTDAFVQFQEFVLNYTKPELDWTTGISIIDCAEYLIKEAEGNGNI